LKILSTKDLLNLVDGAAIFSAGGGGAPEEGYRIVQELEKEGYMVKLADPMEIPDQALIVNFACVGATASTGYNSQAAVKALKTLQEYVGREFYAVIPIELGGLNTLVAADVAARLEIPLVDADGAGRAVPEVHLKVYTIDNIPLVPMVISDINAKNIVIVKETSNFKSAERIARVLASEWNQLAYTARRILTGKQVKTSPIQHSLSKAVHIGKILHESSNPIDAILTELKGFKIFEGTVTKVERKTSEGFTWTRIIVNGEKAYKGKILELKAKNEILAAYINEKLAAIAPDIITPIDTKTGKCITAEKIAEKHSLTVIGLRAPEKWRTEKGLKLWQEVLEKAEIHEKYVPIEHIHKC